MFAYDSTLVFQCVLVFFFLILIRLTLKNSFSLHNVISLEEKCHPKNSQHFFSANVDGRILTANHREEFIDSLSAELFTMSRTKDQVRRELKSLLGAGERNMAWWINAKLHEQHSHDLIRAEAFERAIGKLKFHIKDSEVQR